MARYYIEFNTVLNKIIKENENLIFNIFEILKKESGTNISYKKFYKFFNRFVNQQTSILFYKKETQSLSYYKGKNDEYLKTYLKLIKKSTDDTHKKINLSKIFRQQKLKDL